MTPTDRKKVGVIVKYAVESFTEGDWIFFGQMTGQLKLVTGHPRLLRSLGFGDDDYEMCAAEVLDAVFTESPSSISEVVDHFDIDLWYQQKCPEKYQRVFGAPAARAADFWVNGYLKMFVSHLSENARRMSSLKANLAVWGISAFIAHEDIQPSREWRDEVEAGLETMDVLAAVVEPGFKESDWCVQEVGFALGRKIDIFPLCAGMDPFGFFGKYQGLQVKGKTTDIVARELAHLLLKKPQHRDRLLQGMMKSFSTLGSENKIEAFNQLDSWSVITDQQLKTLLEQASLSAHEKTVFLNMITRVGAFAPPQVQTTDIDDEMPF